MKKTKYSTIKELDLDRRVIDSLSDSVEVAHIRIIDNDLYIVLTYPVDYNTLVPICVKINSDEIRLYYNEIIDFSDVKKDSSFTEFLLYVLKRYEHLLERINMDLEKFESSMDEGLKKEDIQNFFSLNKTLIYYETALDAIKELMDYIEKDKSPFVWNNDSASEFANIKIELTQLNNNIEMYQKIISLMISVSDSLFSNKLNKTMKKLTTVTLVLAIPTFITSFYGMNIDLPFQEHPNSLFIVFLISFALTAISSIYLYYKDYF